MRRCTVNPVLLLIIFMSQDCAESLTSARGDLTPGRTESTESAPVVQPAPRSQIQEADDWDEEPSVPLATMYLTYGSGYYPHSSRLQGGYRDMRRNPLHTLQAYLKGRAPYVSVAMDPGAFPYGTRLRILELERKYRRRIEFRVVDTGGAFFGKGTSRVDICTASETASHNRTINNWLTLVVVEDPKDRQLIAMQGGEG